MENKKDCYGNYTHACSQTCDHWFSCFLLAERKHIEEIERCDWE